MVEVSGGLSCPARFHQSYEAPSFRRRYQESQDEQERPHSPRYFFLISENSQSISHPTVVAAAAGSGGGGGGAGSERRWCRSCSLRRRRR